MAYQTAVNKGTLAAPGGPISVGPITPNAANSLAVVACSGFSTIAAYGSWNQSPLIGNLLYQQFAGQPSITNTATITYSDNNNDEWAAVMAVFAANGTTSITAAGNGSFSAFHYPSADPHIISVNSKDAIFVYVGVGTSAGSGQNGGDPGITVADSDNNQYTFVKEVSGTPHDNVAYLFVAFNVPANAALTITVTGGTPTPSTGPVTWAIFTATHLINPSGFNFGSSML